MKIIEGEKNWMTRHSMIFRNWKITHKTLFNSRNIRYNGSQVTLETQEACPIMVAEGCSFPWIFVYLTNTAQGVSQEDFLQKNQD